MGDHQRSAIRALFIGRLSRDFLRRICRDESGQSITEYILLLSVIIAGTTTLVRGVLGVLNRSILGIGGVLEKDLKTGRAGYDIWSK